MGPALACSARQHDSAVWRGLVGLVHDGCKLGTMKWHRFNSLVFGVSCVRVQQSPLLISFGFCLSSSCNLSCSLIYIFKCFKFNPL